MKTYIDILLTIFFNEKQYKIFYGMIFVTNTWYQNELSNLRKSNQGQFCVHIFKWIKQINVYQLSKIFSLFFKWIYERLIPSDPSNASIDYIHSVISDTVAHHSKYTYE